MLRESAAAPDVVQADAAELAWRDLDQRLRDLDFSHLSEFGRSMSDAAGDATEEMRALIDRAIRNGQATPVR